MVTARFVKTGDKVRATGPGRAAADRKLAGELRLAGGGKRRAFLMAHADPFDFAAADCIGERVERVADQSENMLDTDPFERADQHVCDRLCHQCLLSPRVLRSSK